MQLRAATGLVIAFVIASTAATPAVNALADPPGATPAPTTRPMIAAASATIGIDLRLPTPGPTPPPTPTPMPTVMLPAPTPMSALARAADYVPPITNERPLPACKYDVDVPTTYSSLDDWQITMVDPTYTVPDTYAPNDLVSAAPAGFYSGYEVRSFMLPDLTAMASAAADAGAPLGLYSTYRDYETQVYTFGHWVGVLGYGQASLGSARPGHSEHQLGLALDFTTGSGGEPWAYYNFAQDTAAGAWLSANAWKYGFIMSYPYGKSPSVTCYGFEPWHYRYMGRAAAADIKASGLTLREWLWLRQPGLGPRADRLLVFTGE